MNIAVISDLHLGSEETTDSFEHDEGEFLRFLSFLEDNFERIVLLGDIWETLTERCPWQARRGLAEARARHPEIARRFSRPRYQYIHGNHDFIAGAVDGAPERWSFDVDGKRLLFMHGHGADRFLSAARHLAELGVWIGGWLRRVGCARLYRQLDRLEQRRFDLAERHSSFERWAAGEAGEAGADIVVTGHTHVACTRQRGSLLLMNSGSCSRGVFTYLALDTRKDVYSVEHTW